jgi:hypothetical protein
MVGSTNLYEATPVNDFANMHLGIPSQLIGNKLAIFGFTTKHAIE